MAKQLRIAGTERKGDVEIEDAAQIYRGHMLTRMEFGKKEKTAKDELIALVKRKVDEGSLELPPGTLDGEVVTVYRFEGEDGEELEVKYGRKNQVRVRKAKETGDEDPEVME